MFTDEDFEELLDYLAWKDSLCPRCSEPKHESFDGAHQWVYRAEVLQCHACAALDRAMGKVTGEMGALRAVLNRRPGIS